MIKRIIFFTIYMSISMFAGGPAWAQGEPFSKEHKGLGKAHFGLQQLHDEYQTHLARAAQAGAGAVVRPFKPSNPMVRVANDRVAVEIVAIDPNSLMGQLKALGLENASVYRNMASGLIPLSKIADFAALKGVRSLRPVLAMTHSGLVNSQGDYAMMSDVARLNLAIDGAGVTVGTLSDSYDNLGGAAGDVASSDLPSGVTVLSDMASGGTDEGRAMMQIVHDVAPGTDQAFHTAFSGQADFALGIEELAGCPPGSAAGCTLGGVAADVIVDDVIYFAEPMFQDGIIAQAVDNVKANGVAYFSSAGNSARESYQNSYLASGVFEPTYGGDLHDFDIGGGVDAFQSITIPVGGQAIVVLQWDQPFFSVSSGSGSTNDLDLWLFDSTGTTALASSFNNNVGLDPVEIIQFTNPGPGTSFNIGISLYSGSAPGLLKYVYFGNMTVNEYDTQSSTIYGHANALGAEAVGAAAYFNTPQYGTTPPLLNSFSSSGFTDILFDTAGNPNLSLRDKPDIVAPDGGDNTFFGGDYEPNGFPNFFGTSAAAPHAAGAAALLLECDGTLTPDGVYNLLEGTAIDMDVVGYDFNTGWGLVDADAAATSACATVVLPDKIGVYRPGNRRFYLDQDGSGSWNAGDVVTAPFGAAGDVQVSGDWNGDSLDEIGVFRPSNRRFYLDMDGSGNWNAGDVTSAPFGASTDLPVVGDWNNDGIDEIGVFRPSSRRFYLDMDGSRGWNAGDVISAPFGASTDLPVAGDWNNDGADEIGVFRPSNRRFYLDMDGSGNWSASDVTTAPFGAGTDLPVAGDWNSDGTDEIGVYRPSSRRFYLDTDGSYGWNAGDVVTSAFGNSGDLPVTGKW